MCHARRPFNARRPFIIRIKATHLTATSCVWRTYRTTAVCIEKAYYLSTWCLCSIFENVILYIYTNNDGIGTSHTLLIDETRQEKREVQIHNTSTTTFPWCDTWARYESNIEHMIYKVCLRRRRKMKNSVQWTERRGFAVWELQPATYTHGIIREIHSSSGSRIQISGLVESQLPSTALTRARVCTAAAAYCS